jgi:predicted dehydrogenase
MKPDLNRRDFLKRAAFTTASTFLIAPAGFAGKLSPNDKLNLGVIGVSGRGRDNLNEVSSQNLVALCDVDDTRLAAAAQKFPAAKTYNDFRRLIEQKDLDAIVVSTPDHTHAVATIAALKSGRPVYCEKPLTRTVSECRIVTELARTRRLVTQIGTQIHAGTNYRRVVELIQTGTIGPVREVHVWSSTVYGGIERPTDTPPVPSGLHWDLWLGPVEYRPYHPEYAPAKWRNWWAFGGGSLADFGCHFMDLPHWALNLRHPLAVEIIDGPAVHPESVPPWLIVRYTHPARGEKPPVMLTWYHGGKQPALLEGEQKEYFKSGVLFVGEKGRLLADYTRRQLLPEKDFDGFKAPAPFIPDSLGHHKEWIEACKTGGPTTCAFDYSGPLTETALLGNVAYRAGLKLEWDAKALRAKNSPDADRFIHHHYRNGWAI